MTDSYKMSNSEEERVKNLLSELPKHSAPVDFEAKLMDNIRKIDNGEDVTMLKSEKRSWIVPTLSTAAGLAAAFVLFNTFDATSSQPAPQLANQPIEAPVDTTKDIPTTNSGQLNLVKDKK